MAEPDNHLLRPAELSAAKASLSGWTFDDERLHRTFVFGNFCDAMAFMTRVAFDAERLCHHPNWSNVYKRVEVTLWSHDHGGISALCIELAQAMDAAAASAKI